MSRFHVPLVRTSLRIAFLTGALFLALVFWSLPSLLNLDQFRPDLKDLLEKTFSCRSEIGHVHANLLPYPSLVISRVVLLEPASTPRVLASVSAVHLWIAWDVLLTHQWRFSRIRFIRPRFILHREWTPSEKIRWSTLTPPRHVLSTGGASLDRVDVMNGSVEVWDHTTVPTEKWVMDRLNGNFQILGQEGAFTAQPRFCGPRSRLDLRFDGSSVYPIEARLTQADLKALQKVLRMHLPMLEGSAELIVKARLPPAIDLRATVSPLLLNAWSGTPVWGTVTYQQDHLKARLTAGTSVPMTLDAEGYFLKNRWSVNAVLSHYEAPLIRKLYSQTWLNKLSGQGVVTGAVQSDKQGHWTWSAIGKDFTVEMPPLRIPEWSADGDSSTVSVGVHAVAANGGAAEIAWSSPGPGRADSLRVEVSSVTFLQVLQVFNVSPSTSSRAGKLNPWGFEPWRLDQGSLRAEIHPGKALTVQESHMDTLGMHVDLTGNFDLATDSGAAKIQGVVQKVPLGTVVASFFNSSPIHGTAQASFTLTFPLSAQWLRGFSGSLQGQVANGVIRELKTFYRILSVLNLTNYLRLRLPRISAQGIEFRTLDGRLTLVNGLVTTNDLFLRSTDMNIGVVGAVDLLEQRIDVKVRLELLRFLENVLKNLPITERIYKKANKIFLPLVVRVVGPLGNPEVQ